MDFFEKAGEFCEKAVNATVDFTAEAFDNTKLFIEKQKIRNKISDEQANIDKNYKEIGHRFFVANEQDPPSEFSGIFASIVASKASIEMYRKKIDELDVVDICPYCGADIKKGQRFCGTCGTSYPKQKRSSEDTKPKASETYSDDEVKVVSSENIEVV